VYSDRRTHPLLVAALVSLVVAFAASVVAIGSLWQTVERLEADQPPASATYKLAGQPLRVGSHYILHFGDEWEWTATGRPTTNLLIIRSPIDASTFLFIRGPGEGGSDAASKLAYSTRNGCAEGTAKPINGMTYGGAVLTVAQLTPGYTSAAASCKIEKSLVDVLVVVLLYPGADDWLEFWFSYGADAAVMLAAVKPA
jgi:hypothetical protein